jgi:peptidyl-tRNA hydrolase, PTH1 family
MGLLKFLRQRLGGWSERPAPLGVAAAVKVIVGLGNPGAEYVRSRHNVGFMVLDRFAVKHTIRFNQKRANSLVARGRLQGTELVLAKPQTYMNLSGKAVQGLLMTHGLKPASLLVVYDDFDLPLGTLRMRERGSAGTHNGMRSIVQYLKSDDFPRLRIGIGTAGSSARDHVLGDFEANEQQQADEACERAVEAIETFVLDGAAAAMNRYNR